MEALCSTNPPRSGAPPCGCGIKEGPTASGRGQTRDNRITLRMIDGGFDVTERAPDVKAT